ncbi:MAG: integron integrase [candidate division NC10 bacterium]|nr:integron integrase [candidate division NC10 bacterium]
MDRAATSPSASHSSGQPKPQPSAPLRDSPRPPANIGTRHISAVPQPAATKDASLPATPLPSTAIRPQAPPCPPARPPKLLDQLREALRSRHYSRRTEESYCHWACLPRREAARRRQVKRFIFFHHVRHPAEMAEPEINPFLTHLAIKENVSGSTQNQALSALRFLYRHVLGREVGDLGHVMRARRPHHLPVVMTREEVKAVLGGLRADKWLMASLMYGAGLRLMECLRLPIHDIDLARNDILVRDGKGAKDRITMLPESLKTALQDHLRGVKAIHDHDLADGGGRVQLPHALDRTYPGAPAEWRWQWVFPQESRWRNPRTREEGRPHIDASRVQRAVKDAVRRAGIMKRATCHTFRHSFATHVLEAGYDIRTVQDLRGHQDVRTPMISTHVLNRGGRGLRSPADTP